MAVDLALQVEDLDKQALELAEQMKDALAQLQSVGQGETIPVEPTDNELLDLPLVQTSIPDSLLESLPGRKSSRYELALKIAALVYPIHTESLAAIIRYELDRIRICRWIRLSRRRDILVRTMEREEHDWRHHIKDQGPWNPIKQPISLKGPPSLPMPVDIATAESLKPFFDHLSSGGTHRLDTLDANRSVAKEIKETYYNTLALELERGVVYEDRRLDLCKMVVGPTHITELMDSLRDNQFIKHFLLGNNIVGPQGARAIASFLRGQPNKIDTWYLAGNAIHGPAFSDLVDALTKSPAVTNIWLKRNPPGAGATSFGYVDDLFKLITQTPNLRTLDLDQTELVDAGLQSLFQKLCTAEHRLPLQNLYLNGNGLGSNAAHQLAVFLKSPLCDLKSLYMSNNPIGDNGAKAIGTALASNTSLERLCLQSIGLTDLGLGELTNGVLAHKLKVFDIGTSYSTEDLGQAYNVLTSQSIPHVVQLLETHTTLEYLDLGVGLLDTSSLNTLLTSAAKTPSLLYFSAVPSTRLDSKKQINLEHRRLKLKLKEHLTKNVQKKHGPEMTYENWFAEEKRWLISDKTDVRKIDSVYRTRDMGLARRKLKPLDKWWTDENEPTLRQAMGDVEGAVGPVCTAKQKTGFWAQGTLKQLASTDKAQE